MVIHVWFHSSSTCSKFARDVGSCHAKIGPGGPLFAAKIGPTPDHFWLPNLVRVAKSGPGFINLHETSPCPVKFVYMVCC